MTAIRSSAAWLARVGARLPVGVDRRWPGIRWVKRALLRAIGPGEIERDGLRVHVDPTDSLRLAMGEDHECGLRRFIASRLAPRAVAVDGGAHIGWLTLAMAQAVTPGGRVLAFEPDPGNRRLLELNVRANSLDAVVEVSPEALWSDTGTARLYRREDHHGDHRLWDAGFGDGAVAVNTVTLDQALADGCDRVDLLKLDLQGAEDHALRGAESLLRAAAIEAIALELWPRGLRGCGADAGTLLDRITSWGYSSWRLDRTGRLWPVDPRRLLTRLEPKTPFGRLRARLRRRDDADLILLAPGVGP